MATRKVPFLVLVSKETERTVLAASGSFVRKTEHAVHHAAAASLYLVAQKFACHELLVTQIELGLIAQPHVLTVVQSILTNDKIVGRPLWSWAGMLAKITHIMMPVVASVITRNRPSRLGSSPSRGPVDSSSPSILRVPRSCV